jgi:hypothetical protein
MFPTRGDLHVVPFTDEALYMEQYNKVHIPTLPSLYFGTFTISLLVLWIVIDADSDPELILKSRPGY